MTKRLAAPGMRRLALRAAERKGRVTLRATDVCSRRLCRSSEEITPDRHPPHSAPSDRRSPSRLPRDFYHRTDIAGAHSAAESGWPPRGSTAGRHTASRNGRAISRPAWSRGIDRYLTVATEYLALPTLSALEPPTIPPRKAYETSVAANREHFRRIIGAVDDRLCRATDSSLPARLVNLRWPPRHPRMKFMRSVGPYFPAFTGEGLLLEPTGRPRGTRHRLA